MQSATDSTVRSRVLAVCNVDLMAWVLLRQWLKGLQDAGYEVHIACTPGPYFQGLRELGFVMHPISVKRTFAPWAHIRPIIQLHRIIREGRFDAINMHSAVGAAVGRLAAVLSGHQLVVYTVHGFLFHENMHSIPRRFLTAMEWILGIKTAGFMFVSAEDERTALKTGIIRTGRRFLTIFNGVDLAVFAPKEADPERLRQFRRDVGINEATPIVGIIGRIVREKGYREFLEMAQLVIQRHRVRFLVVGDTLPSDRDQFGVGFKKEVKAAGMEDHFIFTGQTALVADYLRIMDIFVLPSYREGFPRSIVEAMSAGLPVIATNIRGCREAVAHNETGFIVPVRDGAALAQAVERLLENPNEALAMGRAGRARAIESYDYEIVKKRFIGFLDEIIIDSRMGRKSEEKSRS